MERYPSVFQEMIRYVFPKGEAKDGYTEEEIMRLMNHINSYPRKKWTDSPHGFVYKDLQPGDRNSPGAEKGPIRFYQPNAGIIKVMK